LNALLHAISLGRVALADIWSGFENSPLLVVKQAALISRLQAKVAQLEEELHIKDARMERIPPRERPHYPPVERFAILALRAAVGWTVAETARRFFVTAATISAWMRRLDEQGEAALVALREPVNRFPDFVGEIVVRMKATLPTMGRRRIADLLARAGVELAPTTVARLLERPRREPPPLQPAPVVKPVKSEGASDQEPRRVAARYNHHVWHVDLTVVGCFGLWLPWWPCALPVRWPFCWWVGAVIDQHSRAVLATLVAGKEPTAAEVSAMLDRAATAAGRAPRHIISDHGSRWARVEGEVHPRTELGRRIAVPLHAGGRADGSRPLEWVLMGVVGGHGVREAPRNPRAKDRWAASRVSSNGS
jgi:transposase-like protein